MVIVLGILVLYFFLVATYNSKTTLRRCYSFSCLKNMRGKCMLKEIDIYDNGVIGICLWHTSDMNKRILEPYNKGRVLGKIDGELELIDRLVKGSEDIKAIKDPEEFKNWLKRHGIGGKDVE